MVTGSADEGDERLRRIEAVTDTALSYLDTESLFAELLERVRGLLGVDTAAIMLLDRDTQQLVAVAAKGLEEEVLQGFHVEMGHGFTGRVAEQRAPIMLDRIDPTTVVSPVLLQRGLATLLGVPMVAEGELVGVLHVGTIAPREFTEEDVALLQRVADRVGLASQARAARTDRAATLALQRSLLPTLLPKVPGFDLAARYVPGHELGVGGDWYDVFVLPSGRLGVVVGDVAGHGLRSAVVMGRLRSALRAYALECDDPADALSRLDRKIRHFETGSLATVLYAIFEPDGRSLQVSLAGHLPPVVASPGRPACVRYLAVDVPVGVGYTRQRQNSTIDLPADATILFYTDGLVERRDAVIDEGIERLCSLISPGPAEEVCARVIANMDVARARDDVALLAVSRLSGGS